MKYVIKNKKNDKLVLGWEVDFKGKPYSIYESDTRPPLIFFDLDDATNTAKRLGGKYYVCEYKGV